MNSESRKQTARRIAHARRASLSAEQRAERGAEIVRRTLDLPEVRQARTILAYVSIGPEVPTAELLSAILGRGVALLLPYVAEDGALRAATVTSVDELEPGYRRIPEPRARLPVDAGSADVIVVPGVAFDANGNRLGYGGGFYDRLLRAAPGPVRAGLAFDAQIADSVPADRHDERVDVVVTETRELRAKPRESR